MFTYKILNPKIDILHIFLEGVYELYLTLGYHRPPNHRMSTEFKIAELVFPSKSKNIILFGARKSAWWPSDTPHTDDEFVDGF